MTAPCCACESVTEIAARQCPSDPREIVLVLRYALSSAMRRKADGSTHIRSCLASGVNAIPVACSDACLEAQVALVWASTWLGRGSSREAS